jgi:hypothetical protein
MERPSQAEDIQRLKDTLRGENTERDRAMIRRRHGNAESDKPPIDIAKELEQGGFGNTLKKLVDRAKEEAKKPRPPAQNSADAQGIAANAEGSKSAIENAMNGAAEAAKKADPELSKSMAKMLDGLKDDLVKIAKDAKFNDPPQRSRGDRPMTRPSPSESNSMIDSLRKSASEILAGPSRSSNSGRSAPQVHPLHQRRSVENLTSLRCWYLPAFWRLWPLLSLDFVTLNCVRPTLPNCSLLVHRSSHRTSIVELTSCVPFMNSRCGLLSLSSRGGLIEPCNRRSGESSGISGSC